jgi:hypothetical protein
LPGGRLRIFEKERFILAPFFGYWHFARSSRFHPKSASYPVRPGTGLELSEGQEIAVKDPRGTAPKTAAPEGARVSYGLADSTRDVGRPVQDPVFCPLAIIVRMVDWIVCQATVGIRATPVSLQVLGSPVQGFLNPDKEEAVLGGIARPMWRAAISKLAFMVSACCS